MKTKTVVIAALLIVVITGAAVLYGVLSDSSLPADLPVFNQSGQQAGKTESPPPEDPGGETQTSADAVGANPEGASPSTGTGDGVPESSPPSEKTNETETQPPKEQKNEDHRAPGFTVLDADENDVSLSDMLGKPVVLNFWASWCPPCKSEMPEFDKVFGELGEDVHFMMVCLVDGRRETIATGAAFIEESGYSFPIYYDVTMDAAIAYSVTAIPATYFIDAEGYVVTGVQGAINEETLLRGIGMIS